MKNLFLTIAVAGAFVLASCHKNPFPGFEEQENGTYLLVHKKGTSEVLVDTGGAMFMKIRFLTEKDSVFVDVNAASQTPSYPMRIDKPAFKGDFLDMLAKLHPGDSATFYVRLDSLKKHYPSEFKFEPKFDTMKYLGFNVVVDSIYSRSKVEDFRKKAEAEQDKQMEEMRKVQAVMTPIQQKAKEMEPELKKKDAQLLKPYLAQNKITVKPDADGIYYQETDPGDGTPLMPGMYVGMKYTGKYLDGTIFDANTLVDGQEPYYFHLGQDPMIPGFTNCIMKMKNHGKAIFILPPKMGYNDGLTRVFEVEITDAKKQ